MLKLVIKQQMSILKSCPFKTWCKGNKSNIENNIDHFCEDTMDITHWLPLQILVT